MHYLKRNCAGYLLVIGMLITTSPSFADAAATVEFVWGTAYAVSISGEKRELEKGSGISVGDTVVSESARVQLRFTDGGFVSLTPNSEFRVNAYSYSGQPDGSERIAMELIRGGLRTISGLIGKVIQSAYEMKTSVATMGIRGTEYTVVYGESVSGTVSAGAIAVCNAGGCLDVSHGKSYYIRDENTKPVFISTPASLSPRQPVIAAERIRDKMAEGENIDAMSDKGEARSSRGIEMSSRKENFHQGKADDSIIGGGYDALFFAGAKADKSQHRNDVTFQQAQPDKQLVAFPIADVGNPLSDAIAGGSVLSRGRNSPK